MMKVPDDIDTLLQSLSAQGKVIPPNELYRLVVDREDPRDTIAHEYLKPSANVENIEHQLIRIQAGILGALNDMAPDRVTALFKRWDDRRSKNESVEPLEESSLRTMAQIAAEWSDLVNIPTWWMWQSAIEALISYHVCGSRPDRLKMPYDLAKSRPDDDLTELRSKNAAAAGELASHLWDDHKAWWKQTLVENGITSIDSELGSEIQALIVESFDSFYSGIVAQVERARELAEASTDHTLSFSATWNPSQESKTEAKKRIKAELNRQLGEDVDRIWENAGRVRAVRFPGARSFQRFVIYQTLGVSRDNIAKQERVRSDTISDSLKLVASLAGLQLRRGNSGRPRKKPYTTVRLIEEEPRPPR